MKTKILNLMSSLLLLTVMASCGKNQVSGGSQVNPPNINTYSASGEPAWNELKAWVDGPNDNTQVGIHGIFLKRSLSGVVLIPNMCLKNSIVVGCVDPTGCFKSTNQGVMKGTVKMTTGLFGAKQYSDCDITTSFNLYTKSSNQELKDALNGKSGQFLIKSMTQKNGSIFKVFFGSFDGSTSPTSFAVINTSLPSIVNPTEVGSVSGNDLTKLIDYRIVQ
jgi:hypothetical protein